MDKPPRNTAHRADLAPVALLAPGAPAQADPAALERLVAGASARATEAVSWYLSAKRGKARWARLLRVAAIFGVAAAGVIPVVVTLIHREDGSQLFNAAWASIAIAGSAFCVALDRFFGFSTAWIRYMTTELEIQRQLHAFQYDGQFDRVGWADGRPTAEQFAQTLGRCKGFVQEIDKLIQQETNLWVVEFQDALKQVDEASRAKPAAAAQAAINISVSGIDAAESGWLLAIDDGTPAVRFGKTAAVPVLPGMHVVSVSAQVGERRRTAEKAVSVTAGSAAEVAIAL